MVLEPDEERGGEDLAGAVQVVVGAHEDLELLVDGLGLVLHALARRKTSSAESMNRKPKRRWQYSSCMNAAVCGSWVIAIV